MPEFNPQEFLKSRGYGDSDLKKIFKEPTADPKTASDAAVAATPTAEMESTEDTEDTPWLKRHDIARGLARGGARFGTSLVKFNETLGSLIAPNLTDVVRRNMPETISGAYQGMKEYGEQPSGSTTEMVASAAGEALPYMAIPGGPLEAIATKALGRALPKAIQVTPQFTKGVGFTPQISRAVSPWVGRVGKTVGAAERGAIGGAIADPEHPAQGAATGAAGGLASGALGGFLNSRAGRYLLEHMGPSLASTAAYAGLHGMGVPGGIAHMAAVPNIRWHHSPIGRTLTRVGPYIKDKSGRIIGTIMGPAPTGAAVSGLTGSKDEQ